MSRRPVWGRFTVAMTVGALVGASWGVIAGSVGIGLIAGTAAGVLAGLVWERIGQKPPQH